MRFIKLALILSITLLAQSCNATTSPSAVDTQAGYQPLQATSAQKMIDAQVVQRLQAEHYRPLKLNDAYSQELLEDYLDTLDSRHQVFLASDIARFKATYGKSLDNALKNGDLTAAFDIFNTYQKRRIQIDKWLLKKIGAGLDKLNLQDDQTLKVERKDASWPADLAARRQLWTKVLENQVINKRLNAADDDGDEEEGSIQEQLTNRYENQLNRLYQAEPMDVLAIYMGAYTHSYDPHTAYFTPRRSEDFKIEMNLSLQGIGALLRMDKGYAELVRLIPGGPAAKSGELHPKDRIIAVAQGKSGKFTNVVGLRLDETVRLIRGEKDTVVRLKIMPDAGGGTQIVSLVRDTIELKARSAHKRTIEVKRGDKTYTIGLIQLPSFYQGTADDVHKLLKGFNKTGIDGLIIDLRNNGGGSLRAVARLIGLFMPTAPSVQVRDAQGNVRVLGDDSSGPVYTGPLVVMVNRLSASASEIFAGAIQDYGRGLIIGSQTFGKGTVQTLMPLSKGRLKLTEAKFYRVSGASTQDRGVTPDIIFPSIIDPDDVGENTMPHALPWDKIAPTNYPHSDALQKILPQLQALHNARIKDEPDFQYRLKRIRLARHYGDQKSISLDIDTRRKKQQQRHDQALALANAHRQIIGKKPFASYEALEDYQEAKTKDENGNVKPPYKREIDAYQRETARIVTDIVQAQNQNVQ